MKKSLLFFAMVISCSLLFAQQKNVRIYINPGHGGWDGDDRYQPLPPYGKLPSNLDTLAFWESSSNLDKGLCLYHLLDSVGGFDLKISRTLNRHEDDLPLSDIVDMNNAFGSDFFLSIHSNAGNGMVNYPLQLHSGVDPDDKVENYYDVIPQAQSDRSREICNVIGKNIHSCGVTTWTNDLQVRGDKTFARKIMGWSNGYGVLRWLRTPGEISEGRMHDYPPETYRLMNHEYRWLEAWHFMKSFVNFLQNKKLEDGNIAGDIRDLTITSDDLPKYNYVKGSRDQQMPINGAEVCLVQGKDTLRRYTTDQLNNGFWLFSNVKPGTYKVVVKKDKYYTVEKEIIAKADETVYWLADVNMVRMTPPVVVNFTPANNTTDKIVCSTPLVFDFNWDMNRTTTAAALRLEPATEGTITWEKEGHRMVFTPNEPYKANTVYTVHLDTTATHPDTNYPHNLEKEFISQFITDAHDSLKVISTTPAANEEIGVNKPYFYILLDGQGDTGIGNENIIVTDAEGKEITKNKRTYSWNKVKSPYGSYKFEIGENLQTGKDYNLVIKAKTADKEMITVREDVVIPFSIKPLEKRNLVDAVDCKSAAFAYDASQSNGVKSVGRVAVSSTKLFNAKSNQIKYSFNDTTENAYAEFSLKTPIEVTSDMNLLFVAKGDFTHNKVQIKLVNADKSDSIYLDAFTLDGYNWKEYKVEMAEIPADEKWNAAALVINHAKHPASSLPGELYIESIYRDYESGNAVEQVVGENVSIWPNPSTDFVYVEAPENADINLYTIDGKLLFSQPAINKDSETNSLRNIETYNLDNGVYIINIKTDKNSQSLKFIKE